MFQGRPEAWAGVGTALSLTTGLGLGLPLSHCRNLTSIAGWEPKPCFKLLQAEVTWRSLQVKKEKDASLLIKFRKNFLDNKRKKERSLEIRKGREIILISRYAIILGAINTVYTSNWTILYVNCISVKLEGKKERSHSQNIIERCFTVPGENVKIS